MSRAGTEARASTSLSADELGLLEEVLATHRGFGDSDYIRGQLCLQLARRLDRLAEKLPGAARLRDALSGAASDVRQRVLGEMVVRCAILHAWTQLDTSRAFGLPLEHCEELLEQTGAYLEAGGQGSPLEAGFSQVERLEIAGHSGLIWSEEHAHDTFGEAFRFLVHWNYGQALVTPGAAAREMLRSGATLLTELVPRLARSALSHTHVIGVFRPVGAWSGIGSSSQFKLGGTIFLSEDSLDSPWRVAEQLLHESLHQKLYDFRRGHSVFPSPGPQDGAKVWSPWNIDDGRGRNYWDTFRALAAFHVYVHLSLFCQLAELRMDELKGSYTTPSGGARMTTSRQAIERAHHLGQTLRALCWDDLGLAGHRLVNWLGAVLDALTDVPPPEGAYVHLLLDLYRREVNSIAFRPGALDGPSARAVGRNHPLARLAREELETARAILATVDESGARRAALDARLSGLSDGTSPVRFSELRNAIADAILDATVDGFRLERPSSSSIDPDELVRGMVERSSRSLQAIGEVGRRQRGHGIGSPDGVPGSL